MKRLLLINPVGRRSGYLLSRFSTFSPLGLAYVAAVTPSSWEVKILDENFERFNLENADLVGITAFTSNINRAYEIAQTYRERNIKVVLGGIHASMLPDEALKYADSVIVGEVESIWEDVIRDFENNSLSRKYIGPRIDLSRFKVRPRRDLLHPNYLWHSVQTSRGCPFNCYFCSVSQYLGKNYRQRDAKDVLDELEEIESEYVAFVDDNLIGHTLESKRRATELFQGMIDRGLAKKWWMQTSINGAEDEHLVDLAAKAGCIFVFIGFETISAETLQHMKKGVNLRIGVENYRRVVDTFHKHGIGVFGAFIIGNDYESPAYYKKLSQFLTHSGIDSVQISILTPLPGTGLMEQMKKEDRLVYQDFPQDWDKYRFSYTVHEPQGVIADTIYAGDNFIKDRLYSFPRYQYRTLKSLWNLRSITSFYATYKFNKALKKSWKSSHYYNKFPSNFSGMDA
jgi:radical SAM superfamily enzyme YgiQ (UPF0313 family)